MAYSWFVRVSPATSDPISPVSYESTVGQPACRTCNCHSPKMVCAIYAEIDESTGLPIISKAAVDDMLRAVEYQCNRPTVLLKDVCCCSS